MATPTIEEQVPLDDSKFGFSIARSKRIFKILQNQELYIIVEGIIRFEIMQSVYVEK